MQEYGYYSQPLSLTRAYLPPLVLEIVPSSRNVFIYDNWAGLHYLKPLSGFRYLLGGPGSQEFQVRALSLIEVLLNPLTQ